MKKFESIEASMSNLKKPFKSIALGGILLNTATVLLTIWLLAEPLRKYSTLETCLYGMESLFNNDADNALLDEKVIADVKQVNFQMDKITLVKAIDNYHCDVVVKDSKGFRSYKVKLEKSGRFTHGYRIFDIKGQRLVSKYQYKEGR